MFGPKLDQDGARHWPKSAGNRRCCRDFDRSWLDGQTWLGFGQVRAASSQYRPNSAYLRAMLGGLRPGFGISFAQIWPSLGVLGRNWAESGHMSERHVDPSLLRSFERPRCQHREAGALWGHIRVALYGGAALCSISMPEGGGGGRPSSESEVAPRRARSRSFDRQRRHHSELIDEVRSRLGPNRLLRSWLNQASHR